MFNVASAAELFTLSHHTMFVALALYSEGRFRSNAEAWSKMVALAPSAFAWRPIRFSRAHSLVARLPGDRAVSEKLFASVAAGFAEERFDGVDFYETSAREDRATPFGENYALFTADYTIRSVSSTIFDPPNVLPCDVNLVADVGDCWPSVAERLAVCELAQTAQVRYGCIFVSADRDQASSEGSLVSHYGWPGEVPAWTTEIERMARWRHLLGERVRGAYWGNFLSSAIVDAVGGRDALSSTGASIVEQLSPEITYVQLTPTVGEALGEAGLACMDKLRALVASVAV